MKHDYSTNYETLRLIQWYIGKRGYAPTYAEIADLRGMSEMAVRKHVRFLIGTGHLRRNTPRAWRNIKLMENAA